MTLSEMADRIEAEWYSAPALKDWDHRPPRRVFSRPAQRKGASSKKTLAQGTVGAMNDTEMTEGN